MLTNDFELAVPDLKINFIEIKSRPLLHSHFGTQNLKVLMDEELKVNFKFPFAIRIQIFIEVEKIFPPIGDFTNKLLERIE